MGQSVLSSALGGDGLEQGTRRQDSQTLAGRLLQNGGGEFPPSMFLYIKSYVYIRHVIHDTTT